MNMETWHEKNIRMISGIVVLALLLTGAAFIGGRLLNGQGLCAGPSCGPGGEQVQPAEELPQTPADLVGFFDHRQDQSVFVSCTPKYQPCWASSSTTLEAVVTSQTMIYQDVTMDQFDGPPPKGQEIQQVVELGSLDEIGQQDIEQPSLITVWGRKTGDRILANVLVYYSPVSLKK